MTGTKTPLQWTIAMLVLAMAMAWAAPPVLAQDDDDDGDWTQLGEAEVGDQDADNRVQISSSDRSVTHLRLRVGQKSVRVNSLVVSYEGGSSQTIKVGQTLEAGEMTKSFDLTGKKRRIERIVVNAALAKGEEGKAKLIVYGHKG